LAIYEGAMGGSKLLFLFYLSFLTPDLREFGELTKKAHGWRICLAGRLFSTFVAEIAIVVRASRLQLMLGRPEARTTKATR
jgi:hypothetical protein